MPKARTQRTPDPVVSKTRWQASGIAATLLDVSPSKLASLRKSGALRESQHYRDVSPPGAGRATFQYHVSRCDELLTKGLQAIAAGGVHADG